VLLTSEGIYYYIIILYYMIFLNLDKLLYLTTNFRFTFIQIPNYNMIEHLQLTNRLDQIQSQIARGLIDFARGFPNTRRYRRRELQSRIHSRKISPAHPMVCTVYAIMP